MKSHKLQKVCGTTLSESTLGIICFGNVGRAVSKRASAFGMSVLISDIFEINTETTTKYNVSQVNFEYLLSHSDYISLNSDLNPSSFHLINAKSLNLIKNSACIINTARGSIINEPDLIIALNNKAIKGAALDVFDKEPLIHTSPLLQMDNVLLAPHNSNSSPMRGIMFMKTLLKCY